MSYTVRIRGTHAPDDGYAADLGELPPATAWWELPLPRCPDCGGDLVWWEAGYVPGTRRCAGVPVGGRPTNPLLDGRVPLPHAPHRPRWPGREVLPEWAVPGFADRAAARATALLAERNECPEDQLAAIDRELVDLLYPWCHLSYDLNGGCGSLFSVRGHRDERDLPGHVVVRRERFYP